MSSAPPPSTVIPRMSEDTRLPSTTRYGEGIQKPLDFVGYNAEVNLVLSSYYGFVTDQTSCIPYIINIRYFRPEY